MKQVAISLALCFLAACAESQNPTSSSHVAPVQTVSNDNSEAITIAPKRYMAELEVGSVEELENFLTKVEQQYSSVEIDGPIRLVLHGKEINSYIVDNYSRYQSVVEKSTELTAKGFVEIEICERWMASNGVEKYRLQPFVKTVSYAPARVKDLKQQQYSYF